MKSLSFVFLSCFMVILMAPVSPRDTRKQHVIERGQQRRCGDLLTHPRWHPTPDCLCCSRAHSGRNDAVTCLAYPLTNRNVSDYKKRFHAAFREQKNQTNGFLRHLSCGTRNIRPVSVVIISLIQNHREGRDRFPCKLTCFPCYEKRILTTLHTVIVELLIANNYQCQASARV